MQTSSKERPRERKKVTFKIDQPPVFTTETTTQSFPPLMLPDKRSSWKRLSFGRSSSQPIRLSVLKLDGSTFDIFVTKKATVAKVKRAVETAFSHLPKQGDNKISWSHVWGHFCLCFEHMKLLKDHHPITRFGIKNGDQIQFVRRTPVYILAGETSETFTSIPDEPEGSSSKSDYFGDMTNKKNVVQKEGEKDFGANKKSRSNWVKGLFSHRKQDGVANGRSTIRLRLFPLEDEDSNEMEDVSCKSSTYSSTIFSDYVGGFGYPTGYCLK